MSKGVQEAKSQTFISVLKLRSMGKSVGRGNALIYAFIIYCIFSAFSVECKFYFFGFIFFNYSFIPVTANLMKNLEYMSTFFFSVHKCASHSLLLYVLNSCNGSYFCRLTAI